MSTISSIGSLLNAYESTLSGGIPGSDSSSGDFPALSAEEELQSSLSSVTDGGLLSSLAGSSSAAASSFASEIETNLSNQTSLLSAFYNESSALSSSAGTLYNAAQDPSSLSYDDVSSFVDSFNSLLSGSGASLECVDSGDLSNLKESVTDNSDELSAIGITANSDGTLSIDKDIFQSALSNDPNSVASTLGSLASSVQSASQTLSSNTLASYSSDLQKQMGFYATLNQYEAESAFLGQLFDTKA